MTNFPSAGQLEDLEHSPENHAKKVNNYVWDSVSGGWVRDSKQLVPGVDYDFIDVQQTDADTETYVYKMGGSGGSTIRTIVVNYTSSSKDDIDNIGFS